MYVMSGNVRNAFLRDERLAAVFRMLGSSKLIADIGCDHGLLSAALVSEGRAERVIASDISPHSVRKAAKLAESTGFASRMKAVCADGLGALRGEEPPYRLAVCGMGGELIARLIEKDRDAALKAELIVMQPMRGEAELRRYLFDSGFGITDECVVPDSGRYYQVIAAKPGADNIIPEGFPKDCFRFGWVMAEKRDPNLMPLLLHYRSVYENELIKARAKGASPEPVLDELGKTDSLIAFLKGQYHAFG